MKRNNRCAPQGRRSLKSWPTLEELESRCLLNAGAQFAQLPMAFVSNLGQVPAAIQFVSRGDGYAIGLTPTAAVLSLAAPPNSSESAGHQATLEMRIVGADRRAYGTPLDELPGTSNYLVGSDPSQWHTDVPTFKGISYQSVYPGIDLKYYGNQHQLEYDFVVSPQARADRIRLQFVGADTLTVDAAGNLVIGVVGRTLIEKAPTIYQDTRPC